MRNLIILCAWSRNPKTLISFPSMSCRVFLIVHEHKFHRHIEEPQALEVASEGRVSMRGSDLGAYEGSGA